MAEIYLIRPGETEWNAAGRFQGKLDSPLTVLGEAQAKACGNRLVMLGLRFDAVISSPLGRTRQTAVIIRTYGDFAPTQFDERLAEVSVGSWDGLTHVDIDAQWPGLLDGTNPFDWFFRSPDGESYESVHSRATEWLAEQRGSVLAISHGLVGRVIRGAFLNLPKNDALALPVPQDVIWRLANGRIESISIY